MGNGNSSSSSSGSSGGRTQRDFEVCVAKHTANGDGSRGAYGDVAVLQCMVERKVVRAVENGKRDNTSSRARTRRCRNE